MSGRDLVGSTIAGRYKVLRKLGAGGMGAVWEVQHLESLQHYALKTLHAHVATDPMSLERFLREARAAAALRSKSVVRIIDAQTTYVDPKTGELTPFLVMELLEGSTLEAIIQKRGALTSPELVWVLRGVGRALDVAHQKGIVHRDLKPENVFIALDEDGEPITKVCDFGIAKLGGDSGLMGQNPLGTQTGATVGTPLYMSPEQAWNSSSVGVESDQWSIGLIAFKALTGTDYFGRAKSTAELVLMIVERAMTAPSSFVQLPESFDRWFFKSCNRDARQRFSSVGEQIQSLAEALDVTRPVPPPVVGAHPGVSHPTQDAPPATPSAALEPPGTPVIPTQVALSPMTPAGTSRTADERPATTEKTKKGSRGLFFALAGLGIAIGVIAGVVIFQNVGHEKEPPKPAKTIDEKKIEEQPSNESASAKPSVTATVTTPEPIVSTSASALPTTKPPVVKSVPPPKSSASAKVETPSGKLPKGAPCARSSECASGFCVAEECQ